MSRSAPDGPVHGPAVPPQPSVVGWLAVVSIPLFALGCATHDPQPDRERLDQMVADRIGHSVSIAPATRDAWDPAEPLTAGRSVVLALESSPELRQGLAEIARARADVVESRLWPDPVMSLAFGLPTDGLPGDPHVASLMQQLDWLWTRGPRVAAADAGLARAISTVADEALRVIAETRQMHARVVYEERALAAVESWSHAIGLVRQARAAEVASGTRPRADLRRAEVDEERAREALLHRHRELAVARRRLLAGIGRGDGPAVFAVHSAEAAPPVDSNLDEAGAVTRARAQRLDLAAAREQVARLVDERRAAGRSSWIDVGGMVGHERNHEGRKAVNVGAQVRPRLWGSGAVIRARADADLAQAVANAEGVDLRVCEEVRTAWLRWQEQNEFVARIDAGRLALASADLASAEAERRAGIRGQADTAVLAAEYAQVWVERIDAERERIDRYHELVRAAGGTLPSSATPANAAAHRHEGGSQ